MGMSTAHYSTQGQVALTTVAGVLIRVCLFHNRLLFLHSTVGSVNIFAIIFFVIAVGEELTVFGFVRGIWKKLWEPLACGLDYLNLHVGPCKSVLT